MAIQIPEGKQYNQLRWMLDILKRDFPEKYAGLEGQTDRIQGWIDEIDSGTGRDADQIRDDIVKYIVPKEEAMALYGITEQEFEMLILGGNEGGINFSDLAARGGTTGTGGEAGVDAGGGVTVEGGAPAEESIAQEGVGAGGGDPETQLTILTGEEMKWFFDNQSGKWYVEYGLPNSNRNMIFEASPDQMDALFGDNMRPAEYEQRSLSNLTSRSGSTFGGNIAEMEGTGSFESEVDRITALALDEGKLPDWALKDGMAMDIIYTAQAEGKSNEWVLQQLSQTQGFKERFPKIQKFINENNLSLTEGITGFLEMEAGLGHALEAAGMSRGASSPELVGQLLDQGHSLQTVNDTINNFRRMEQFAPALDAFNGILAQQGMDPITDIQGMLDFVSGQASAEVYDLYEASSLAEAASRAGLGDVFSATDAIAAAQQGNYTLETASAGMQKAAEMLLRLRHEVEVGKFGLDHEELIDISLGNTPRSGRSQSEIMESVNRAVLSAQKSLSKRVSPFKQFSRTGAPQAASLGGLRQES